MKLKLTAGNMSDDATLAFNDIGWIEREYPATLSDDAMVALRKAREYLSNTKPYEGTYCRFVSLHAAGLDAPTLSDVIDAEGEDWREGITDLRVFPEKGVFLYMQHDDNAAAWVEFEVLTENGEPV